MVQNALNLTENDDAKIVQFADENKTLPDGSKIIYAESKEKIVVYQKLPFEIGTTYIYERKSGQISINGAKGTHQDKRQMIKLGNYLLEHSKESDLITLNIQTKGAKK
jgi:hypothetical protein